MGQKGTDEFSYTAENGPLKYLIYEIIANDFFFELL